MLDKIPNNASFASTLMKVLLMFLSRLLLVAACAVPLAPAVAHEYWIEPDAYQVGRDDSIQAHFKNGQEFAGITLSYFDRSSVRFDQMFKGKVTPIIARSGDSPAVQLEALNKDGLLVLAYETTQSKITYREWPKFIKFTEHKDFQNAAAEHIANGWPQENFKESYSRHVKSLIGVGTGEGSDAALGLQTEFVALSNPYAEGFDGKMSVALTYQGEPRRDAQVEVFERAPDDTVKITLYRTDSEGNATIPVLANHAYLFDAVVLRPAPTSQEPGAPVWETLWAALTFAVPQ